MEVRSGVEPLYRITGIEGSNPSPSEIMKFTIVNIDKQSPQGKQRSLKERTHVTLRTADSFIEKIKTDTKARHIGRYRSHHSQHGGDVELYLRQHPLPKVYPCAEFSKDDTGALHFQTLTGVIPLCVPRLFSADDISSVKRAAASLPTTLAAFLGADGQSVVILALASPDTGTLPADEALADQFCKLAHQRIEAVYGAILPADVQHQEVTLRTSILLTVDPSPYYCPQAVPQQVDITSLGSISTTRPTDGTSIERSQQSQQDPDSELYAHYERIYERAAEEAYAEVADVVESQQREAYLTELAYRLFSYGLPEEEAVIHVINHHCYHHHYSENLIRSIIAAVYAEHRAPRPMSETVDISLETQRLIRFLTTRYVFRYNTAKGCSEYRPNNSWHVDWKPCDEHAVNGITIQARLAGVTARDKDVRRYVNSDFVRDDDPVSSYLAHLYNRWDGVTDHISRLARCVPCNVPQWEQWFRKWFLGMVAQWMGRTGQYGNAIVPLLISSQGAGKSTFCRMLLPKELSWGYTDSLSLNERRQVLLAMSNLLLINLDEFNQISPKLQEGFLKNILQLPEVKVKRPYARQLESLPRRASFIATSNEVSVLSDPTGSRRFIGIQLTGPVDTSYRPNYEQLYAQAVTLIWEREQYWFDAADVEAVMDHNRQFAQQPPALLFFHEYYEVVADEKEGQWLSPSAIFLTLRKKVGAALNVNSVNRFGTFLSNIPGIQKRRISNSYLYLVRPKA